MSWICGTCGELHDELPLSFAADYPDNYANLTPDQRDIRTTIGSDQCVIDQEQFYIRGYLEIPIQDSDQVFLWGLWALIWERDYDEIEESWEEQGRERRGPFKGRLGNALHEYDVPTFNLPLTIKTTASRNLAFVFLRRARTSACSCTTRRNDPQAG
jgi:hypothetical protein